MKRRSVRILFWLLVGFILPLIATSAVHADEHIQGTLSGDRTELHVGDLVQLTLQVDHPLGYRLVPVQLGERWGEFEVRSVSEVSLEKSENGTAHSSQTIEVTLWAPGIYETPELVATLQNEDGETEEFSFDSLTLEVKPVLVDGDTQLRDIKPQASLPLPPKWPWIIGAFLLVALVGLLVSRLWQRRGRMAPLSPTDKPDLRPAYLIALEELARIVSLNLPAQGHFKPHYSQVADVVRQYLESAFGVPAMDRTTAEIRLGLSLMQPSRLELREMLALLNEADLVKFAKVIPEIEAAHEFPDKARRFVLATHPEKLEMELESYEHEVKA